MDPDLLRALGLSPRQATVLAALGEEADTTGAALAGLTGLSRPQVSEALQALEQHGLVTVWREQRPHVVSLTTDPGEGLDRLLREADQERRRAAALADQAACAVRDRAARLAAAPRARPRRRLSGAGPGADHDLLVAQRAYDEVTRPDSTTVRYGVGLQRQGTVRRLLVLGTLPPRDRVHWLARGVQVREATGELPVLVVVDGVRARVEVGTASPGRTAWTFDPPQVRALQQLFALWWAAAPAAR